MIALGVCCSAVFTALSATLPTFIEARFLLSFCSTICCVAAPMLLVEIAPPFHRATVAGIYNTLYYMGSIIATFRRLSISPLEKFTKPITNN